MSSSTPSTPLAQYAAALRSSGTGASLSLERTCRPHGLTEMSSAQRYPKISNIKHPKHKHHFFECSTVRWCDIWSVFSSENWFQGSRSFHALASKVWIYYGAPIPWVSMLHHFSHMCSEDINDALKLYPTMSHINPYHTWSYMSKHVKVRQANLESK